MAGETKPDGTSLFMVTWHEAVWAKSEKEARAKAVRKFKKERCMVTKSRGLPEEPDPATHCRHGKLWSTYCDYC